MVIYQRNKIKTSIFCLLAWKICLKIFTIFIYYNHWQQINFIKFFYFSCFNISWTAITALIDPSSYFVSGFKIRNENVCKGLCCIKRIWTLKNLVRNINMQKEFSTIILKPDFLTTSNRFFSGQESDIKCFFLFPMFFTHLFTTIFCFCLRREDKFAFCPFCSSIEDHSLIF